MATRTWQCMCGDFKAEVTGEPSFACYCHCEMCRRHTGNCLYAGIWSSENFKIVQGEEGLGKFSKVEDITRYFCSKCGSFAYKNLKGSIVVPAAPLEGGPLVQAQAHIFVADKGATSLDNFHEELPKHDGMP